MQKYNVKITGSALSDFDKLADHFNNYYDDEQMNNLKIDFHLSVANLANMPESYTPFGDGLDKNIC